MSTLTHDAQRTGSVMGAGLLFALVSATSFGLSGSLAKGLIDAGWTPGAAVTVRILGAVAVLAIPALVALQGRWTTIRGNLGFVTAYGLAAVATAQLCFFNAVAYMPVGVALLIEYTAPVAVVAWMWFRHGHTPHLLTLAGSAVAAVGLVLLLDLGSGTTVNLPGILWSLGAMTGAAAYFILSADERDGLPPIALAAGGLLVGGVVILAAGAAGVVSMSVATDSVELAGSSLPWWVPVVGLAVVTAAVAYTTGIAAVRRLGARLASFVALTEVVAAVLFAWLLLAQLPARIQFVGGLCVLAGVVLVKLDEDRSRIS
jgi:drug/metabolite transporter (DMT)-like permease